MKHGVLLILVWAVGNLAFGAEKENALELWARFAQNNTAEPSPLAVTAKLVIRDAKYFVSFQVTNISNRPIQTYPYMLPWGNSNSVTLAAFTTDGQRLQNIYLIDDPPVETPITIGPGQTRQGEYQLDQQFDPRTIPKDRDTILLWAYALFETRTPPTKSKFLPACTGVLVLPKSR